MISKRAIQIQLVITLLILSLSVGCAKGHKFTLYEYEGPVKEVIEIGEESGTQKLCLQWFVNTDIPSYEWKCIEVSELRKLLFPEVEVH